MPFLVATVRAVVMTVVSSIFVTAVRAVTVSPFVVAFVVTSKCHGAEEGNDDEEKDSLRIHVILKEWESDV